MSQSSDRTSQRYQQGKRKLQHATRRIIEHLESRVLLTGSIQATLINDADGDGVQDAGELPLVGWTVYIDDNKNGAFDAGEASQLTDSSGHATFSGLGNGKTDIGEVLPGGWTVSPGFSSTLRVNVNNNQTTPALFLNTTAGSIPSIQGTVWNDIGQDGIRDATDPGIPDFTIFLDLNTNRALDAGEPFTVTNGSGQYSFSGLLPGRYKVREITPAGWDPTVGFDGQNSVDVVAGATATSDFGNFNVASQGSISGTVWNDVNADGVRAAGDPGMGGWTVFLDLNTNGSPDAGEPTALTDAGGAYSFPSVVIGSYRVMEILQSGWNISPGHAAAVNVTVVNEGTPVVDFANWTPTLGSISGKVWNDINADGSSAGEPVLPGWTVFIDSDGDGAVTPGETSAITDAGGLYTLSDVPIGSNVVREIAPVGWSPTSPGTGMQLVTVPNGTSINGINFGNRQRTDGAISGVVFFDANKNGTRDAGERGLSGIRIYLDLNNDGTFDPGEPSTFSSIDLFYTPAVNETGAYEFTHLAAETFNVREVVPANLSATPAAARHHQVDLAVGEQRSNVNFADVFRANEIHGVVFDDANANHARDPGEAGLSGVTIYIDVNRDDVYQRSEPRTISAADGTYSFSTTLTPGAYVLRELHHSRREHTYPTTTGGILWPTGVSNPARGNVTPTSITTSLVDGQVEHDSVSITLPGAGSLTNMVDVFLLFDDTGSFTANSPIVRAAFPQIISALQAAMPGVDFGFGVGRFEEYANFASEFATGRPFVLNQPIIDQNTPGFAASIQAALDRTAPGYGGDQPETDIEALFQMATGRGFDGNNNGTTTDSGAAGLVTTQTDPGTSGDVPSFGSFTVDALGNVLPAAGTIGGAGFRAGALPIILTATDTGFAFQPRGETSITGLDGLTLPLSAFTQTSRPTTPFASGAGLQETVTALNSLGALVIGLGTNGEAGIDPRQGLEALAKLTGAINRSVLTIPNGTLDPISPGDPLYFQIASGFSGSVANGIVTAVENAVTNTSMNITIRASDPRVHVGSSPGVITGVGAGQTATFDAVFTGDGRPHRFDLEFVREGTDVVLGSIPVVIGTPIVGDGFSFEEFEDGEIHNSSDFGSVENLLLPMNLAPSFTGSGDESAGQSSGRHVVNGWATGATAGAGEDAIQVYDFITTNDNNALFSEQPAVSYDGKLTYTPAAGAIGTATVTVLLLDTGGTVGGGQNTSVPVTFTINILPAGPLTIVGGFQFLTQHGLTIDFSQDVLGLLDLSKIQVLDLRTNLPVPLQSLNYDSTLRKATVSFGGATLPDGNYRMTIAAGALPNLSSAYQYDFFVLAGDANRDRSIDAIDLGILSANWQGSSRTFAQGDFNYDRVVDISDLYILASKWQQNLAPPVAVQPASILVRPVRKTTRAISLI